MRQQSAHTVYFESIFQRRFRTTLPTVCTIAGTVEEVARDLQYISTTAASLGLELNASKCEMFLLGGTDNERNDVITRLQTIAPGASVLEPKTVTLLGAPLTDEALILCLEQKVAVLKILLGRLMIISAHHAFFLLRHCLAIPKLMYVLRCSPCWKAPALLEEIDDLIRVALEAITNTRLEGAMYTQATLPVSRGGLGVRRTKALASSAFLGSTHSTRRLTQEIYECDSVEICSAAVDVWKVATECDDTPSELARVHQGVWDNAVIEKDVRELWQELNGNQHMEARLRAVSTKYAEVWLNALPSKVFGNWLDDQTFRLSVGLWLGANVVEPHVCTNCKKNVSEDGLHGLSCKKSGGLWRERHNSVNDVVLRSLCNAGVEAYPESSGFVHEDGKGPDGATRMKWFRGLPLVWDVTVRDTMCDTYIGATSKCAGAAAEKACADKKNHYSSILERCVFVPLVCETFGVWCEEAVKLIREIGKKLFFRTGEGRSTCFMFQRLSIEIMRGNAQLVLAIVPSRASWDKFFI